MRLNFEHAHCAFSLGGGAEYLCTAAFRSRRYLFLRLAHSLHEVQSIVHDQEREHCGSSYRLMQYSNSCPPRGIMETMETDLSHCSTPEDKCE